jgi:adenine deaminase
VAEDGKIVNRFMGKPPLFSSMRKRKLQIKAMKKDGLLLKSDRPFAKVIQLIPGQIVTKKVMKKILLRDGVAYPNINEDILKIVVVERHRATGNFGMGFVQGFGLKRGAIGSTVAHDSHNLVIVGTNDPDIFKIIEAIQAMGGGLAVVSDGKLLASLPLPVAGLMADLSVVDVNHRLNALHSATKSLGCKLPDPFMALSFLSLPVIPELKITDKGLVDVNQFKIVPIFGEE